MKKGIGIFLLVLMATLCQAEERFKSYSWRFTFIQAPSFYQPVLIIEYEYEGDGSTPAVLSLPDDPNYPLLRLRLDVNGKKMEAIKAQMVTYWSHGKPVEVLVPPEPAGKIKVVASFIVKNLFYMIPAPVTMPIDTEKLILGFAPLPNFRIRGYFTGQNLHFRRQKIAARPGDPQFEHRVAKRNLKASGHQELFFLIPEYYTHDTLLSIDEVLADRDSRLSASGDQAVSYNALFYAMDYQRNWQLMPTWIQLEYTNLPYGVIPGGTSENFKLFVGANEEILETTPWVDPLDTSSAEHGVTRELSADLLVKRLEEMNQTIQQFQSSVNVNLGWNRLLCHSDGDEISPALANRRLANLLKAKFPGFQIVPAFITRYNPDLAPRLPLAAYDRVLTAVNVAGNWLFVDGSQKGWDLPRSEHFIKGHNVILFASEQLIGFSF